MLFALMAWHHHLVYQSLDDKYLALVESVARISGTGLGHYFWLKRDISGKSRITDLNIRNIPPVECKYHFLAFSSLPFLSASRLCSFTCITCHLMPGKSPLAFPMEPPMHSTSTSSCSSTSFVAPSPGRNALICLPFFMSRTLTAFLMPEFGCLASTCIFSRTSAFACEEPSSGSDFDFRSSVFLTNHLSFHLDTALLFISFFAEFIPLDLCPILFRVQRAYLNLFSGYAHILHIKVPLYY